MHASSSLTMIFHHGALEVPLNFWNIRRYCHGDLRTRPLDIVAPPLPSRFSRPRGPIVYAGTNYYYSAPGRRTTVAVRTPTVSSGPGCLDTRSPPRIPRRSNLRGVSALKYGPRNEKLRLIIYDRGADRLSSARSTAPFSIGQTEIWCQFFTHAVM